jgi:hypothetical protein
MLETSPCSRYIRLSSVVCDVYPTQKVENWILTTKFNTQNRYKLPESEDKHLFIIITSHVVLSLTLTGAAVTFYTRICHVTE